MCGWYIHTTRSSAQKRRKYPQYKHRVGYVGKVSVNSMTGQVAAGGIASPTEAVDGVTTLVVHSNRLLAGTPPLFLNAVKECQRASVQVATHPSVTIHGGGVASVWTRDIDAVLKECVFESHA